jgi:hypothetical protein
MIRLAEARGSAPGWVSSYGDDLLCLPLVLSVVLTVHRLSLLSGRFTLPVFHGLLAVVLFGILFEGILPLTGARAVADPLDIFMYLAGFLVFQAGLNQPPNLSTNLEFSWKPLKPSPPAGQSRNSTPIT